ncbi:MAG: hypothetical protein IJ105_00490 [Bacilli bacterium]|nr:hypothetical protein [Bacilli bacterium]
MYKHHDLISIYASNKIEARNKTTDFLQCYKKEKIRIIAVEGINNHYEVEVQYFDNYKECGVFSSDVFVDIEPQKSLLLENEKHF